MHPITCSICGTIFYVDERHRTQADTCSGRCRQAKHRRRKAAHQVIEFRISADGLRRFAERLKDRGLETILGDLDVNELADWAEAQADNLEARHFAGTR